MGHDHHFLERLDRVEADHVETALGLYRDHEALHYVLDHLRLPDGAERVALALGSVERGPYVIVTRKGNFVTCLGEGMSPSPHEVVPRARLDGLLAKHHDMKGREEVRDKEQHKREHTRDFVMRLMRRGQVLNREEFVAFSAFAPLMGRQLYKLSLETSIYVWEHAREYAFLTKINPAGLANAEFFHFEIFLAGHCMLLATMLEREELDSFLGITDRPSMHLAALGSTTLLLRGAWAAGRLGTRLFPGYRKSFAKADTAVEVLDDVMALLAIGFRNKDLRGDVRRTLESRRKSEGMQDMIKVALDVFNKPESFAEALNTGREVFIENTRTLPDGDPYKYATEAEVPDDIALTSALLVDADPLDPSNIGYLLTVSPLLAKAQAEDFYFTREISRRVIPEWTPERTLAHAARFKETLELDKKPVRVTPKPGRNDPCSCGSGKKYKKCHGAT